MLVRHVTSFLTASAKWMLAPIAENPSSGRRPSRSGKSSEKIFGTRSGRRLVNLKPQACVSLLACILLLLAAGCAGTPAQPSAVPPGRAAVTITFDYQKQSGYASNQFAVWIEDAEGQYIKTLYATRYTTKGGYKNRPDSVPVWVEKSGLANMSDVDAITGATPQTGNLTYIWDLTDQSGSPVLLGTYRFRVEGTLRWKNQVYYIGEIEIGGAAASVSAKAQFIFEGTADQPALSEDAPENNMIGAVTANFVPVAN